MKEVTKIDNLPYKMPFEMWDIRRIIECAEHNEMAFRKIHKIASDNLEVFVKVNNMEVSEIRNKVISHLLKQQEMLKKLIDDLEIKEIY